MTTKGKGVGRIRTQPLEYLRNRRYWELKEEAEDKKRGKNNHLSLKKNTSYLP